MFVADGRFHLEAIMIANPDIPAFRCPSLLTNLRDTQCIKSHLQSSYDSSSVTFNTDIIQ